jgi:glycosyltransferase involved in cell wall biosynthesis
MQSYRTLLIEGWRYIPHSYAIVNQFQCLEMLKIPWLRIFHRDMPYYQKHWQPVTGLFSPESEATIRSIPIGNIDVEADAVLRITHPYNFAQSKNKRIFVFGTAEFQCVPKEYIAQQLPLEAVMAESNIVIVTPSNWSRAGFIASGGDPKRIVVIPHGVDPMIYHPLGEPEREALRSKIGCTGFTFLTIGAMTGNKGLQLLLKAFAEVSQKHPHVRLLMKGMDALYKSMDFIRQESKELTQSEAERVQERLIYIGGTLNFQDMASLYQASDAYVSPYLAEGFNMPCLEAAACGMLVICTQGGSTDDFTRPEFTLHIKSTADRVQISPGSFGTILHPEYEHLVHQMMMAVEQPVLLKQARMAGPSFVAGGFTWKHVVEKLLEVLFPR